MRIRRLITTICIAIGLLGGAADASISLSQSIDRTELSYEETATLELTLTWSGPQSAYRFPQPLQPELDKLKVGRFATSIATSGADTATTTKTFTYSLIPTGSGLARVEPIVVPYLSWPDSVPGELVTEPVTLNIAAPAPVTPESSGLPVWLLIVVAVLILSGVGGAIVFARRRRALNSPEKTPSQRFLEGLDTLEQEAAGDLKKFQSGLYPLLVEYLTDRFALPLAGKSADEIATALDQTDMLTERKEKLVAWLQRAEREKYQPVQAAPGETIRLANELRAFFEKM
ncbi:hypothetical protein GF420_06430 [candidate division GN15 bacterium]|nr:hypothetical protein [candidate division GN15 bacterium]